MYKDAAVLLPTEIIVAGTASYARVLDPYSYINNDPQWKERAADPLADAIAEAGAAANQLSAQAITAARAVLNLLASLPNPTIAVDDNEITLEWYKDRHHVAVVAVDGQSLSWAVMAGRANPLKGKEPFDKELPSKAYDDINAAAVAG